MNFRRVDAYTHFYHNKIVENENQILFDNYQAKCNNILKEYIDVFYFNQNRAVGIILSKKMYNFEFCFEFKGF